MLPVITPTLAPWLAMRAVRFGLLLVTLAAVAGAGAYGGWHLRGTFDAGEAAKLEAQHAHQEEQRAEVAQEATANRMAETERRVETFSKVADGTQAKLDAIPFRVRDVAAAGSGLQLAAQQVAAACRAGSSDSPASGASAGHPEGEAAGRVLAELSRRLEEAGERVAAVALERAERLAACEAAHDALRAGPAGGRLTGPP
jgi:hypothetical protein